MTRTPLSAMLTSPQMGKSHLGGELPARLEDFHRMHEGETCLVICNGISLRDMPVDFLEKYPSFGCNTIFKHQEFKPWYYAACDSRTFYQWGDEIMARLGDIPKFVPRPNLDKFKGPNFYRFYHRPGPLWPYVNQPLWPSDIMSKGGITYACTPHVMMQFAYFMGFKNILVVGMDHQPYSRGYFWGVDESLQPKVGNSHFTTWDDGHKQLCDGFKSAGVTMLNLTPNSLAQSIPHDDWKNWR